MQSVQRKKRSSSSSFRLALLLLALLVCGVAAVLLVWSSLPREERIPASHHESVLLADYESGDVVRIAVRLRTGQGWTVLQQEPGTLTMEDDASFIVSASNASSLLLAAADIEAPLVLSEDPAEYSSSLAAFGLDNPRLTAEITYADGNSITLRAGDIVMTDEPNLLYMTVDGDDRLFAMDKGTVDLFTVDRSLLREVVQPTLHAARFDRITLTGENGLVLGEWSLEGQIDDADAAERWQLTQPFVYPADADAMSSLRNHMANLRLGAYTAEATEENLALYGFDQPRLKLEIHQAAGDMGTVSLSGEYEILSYPESTLTLTVGGALNQDLDYLLCEGAIYTGSHYSLRTLMELDIRDTLTRYPVTTALGNLTRLVIAREDGVQDYVITRTEQVAENNDLVTDAEGNILYDYAVTCNGQTVPYSAFESAYRRLITVTVSGTLPDGWTYTEAPHTTFTFYDRSGSVRTIALAPCDALHDAVLIDGQALFYLIRDGMRLELE